MEALAKSVQQAQAAVLSVQDDLALLRSQLEDDGATAPADDSATLPINPYYVELQTNIQRKQEAAAQLLQSSAHIFYEQFGAIEEKAARLDNVHQREKELQAAKKSMQRYFDAHAKELAEVRDTHDGAMRLELARRQHLEDGAAELRLCQHAQQQAHHVLHVWLKKAMIRNLTREYMARQSTTRQTYQSVACAALAQQREIVLQQRTFYTWRSRLHGRRLRRVEAAAAESERRAQFFRQELATTQQALHDRLGSALEQRHDTNVELSAKKPSAPLLQLATVAAEHEDEVQRLRTALEEMTLEFSERTGTYIRQQEHLEQLFRSKEQKLQDTILSLQASRGEEQHAHEVHVAQQRTFVEHVHLYWQGQQQQWAAAMQRKEDFAHYTLLSLVGRLRHRHRSAQAEAVKLAKEVHTLAPLSERCVQLENELALSQQLLQKAKEKSRAAEQRGRTDQLVGELLTDRVARAESLSLRARYFTQWMQHSSARSLHTARTEIYELKVALQQQRQQLLLQQQESAARHRAEVAQLRDNTEQLRRSNVRLQSELDATARAQREGEAACHDGAVHNSELAAALLREKMERRGLHDKWWCSRAEVLVLAEGQARCRLETQESQWWSALQLRECGALKVWTAALHYDAAQLTAVCEGWEAHCHRVEAEHQQRQRTAAVRVAGALERGHLQAQTLAWWATWRAWARERRAVRVAEDSAAEARTAMVERHGHELARLHARHDAALRRQQQELTLEKTQLQAIHQDRSETQRRLHAQELARLTEQHRLHLGELQTSHTEVVAEHEDVVRELQDQLEHVGAVVVEYCAAATFAQWRSWAMERRVRRNARQRGGFLLRLQAWHAATAHTQEDALLTKQQLFAEAVAAAAKAHVALLDRQSQRLAQEAEVAATQQRRCEAAQQAAEKEVGHLRAELQHTRALYEAERHDHEALHSAAAAERRDHHTALVLASRLRDWQAAGERLCWEQQRAMSRVFEAAAAEALCDAHIDAQALRETYVEGVKKHEATRRLLKKAAEENKHLTDVHGALTRRHEKLERSFAETTKEVGKLTGTLTALVKEHEEVRDALESATAEKQRAEDAHTALANSYENLAQSHAEATTEVGLLTDTLSALVREHEAVQSEMEKLSAEKRNAEDAHAALASEHAAIRDELTALKAEAQEVQSAFRTHVAAHEQTHVDAAVQVAVEAAAPSKNAPPETPSADRTPPPDSLEVSALNAEEVEGQQHPPAEEGYEIRSTAVPAVDATEATTEGHNNSVTASVVERPVQVLPADFAQRLRDLEACVINDGVVTDAATEEHLAVLLRQPFSVAETSAGSIPDVSAVSLSVDTVNPSEVVAVVCRMLETLRQAAVRWAEAQAQRYTATVDSLDTKRAQSEEALTLLRENMAGLLEEQRSLAGEIRDDAEHQAEEKHDSAERADTPNRSLLFSQTVQERLSALTSRYARVLDAFYSDITRRQDTFYSVNGMLVEVDQFSEGLLERFSENVHEMARLQQLQLGFSSAAASLQPPGTPVSRRISDDLSMMSPEPRHPQQASTPQLVRVLVDTVAPPLPPPQHLQGALTSERRATSSTSTSASASPPAVVSASSSTSPSAGSSTAHSTPERHALRERVHLLEKLLVEAKVQIAETSALMDSARRAASLAAPPSAHAQAWAAQTAKDFADLAVSEAQWLALHNAAEDATQTLTDALHRCRGRLHETQLEMSQQLQTACISVEASLQQRYRAEAERYEAAVRTCNDSLTEATRQQGRERQRYEQLLQQQRGDMAALVEKHTRDTQLMRQSYTAEIEELTDHLNLLEEELQRTRQGTQSAVKDAVQRQTELLSLEHEQRLRSAEKKLTRLMAEKVLLEERLVAMEEDGARRLQQERDGVARLQQQLDEAEAAQADAVADVPRAENMAERREATEVAALHERWSTSLSDTADLYAVYCADTATWFAACVAELLEQAQEEWETEVMHLRERVASLLDKPASAATSSNCVPSDDNAVQHDLPHHGDQNRSLRSPSKHTTLGDTAEDASSQALTLTPSPQRMRTRPSRSTGHALTPPSPRNPTPLQQNSPRPAAVSSLAEPHGTRSGSSRKDTGLESSIGTSPTRCRSPSLDSLELSQSLLRYSKMLSDQRTRNTERLERASALTAAVDDLLLRGVELARLAEKQTHR